jgi:hypothetical protein
MATPYEEYHTPVPARVQQSDEYPPVRRNSEKGTPEKGSSSSAYGEEKTSIRSAAPWEELDKKAELDPSEYREVLINDGNPFPPMPNEIEESSQLTFRAIIVGSLLGLIVGASNIYLGLKTGLSCVLLRPFISILTFNIRLHLRCLPLRSYLRVRDPQADVSCSSPTLGRWILRT